MVANFQKKAKTFLKTVLFKIIIKLIPKMSRDELIAKTKKQGCITIEQEAYEHYIKEPEQEIARHRFKKITGMRKVEAFYGFMLKDVRLIGPYGIPVTRFGLIVLEPVSLRMLPTMLKVTIKELGITGLLKQYCLAIFPWLESSSISIETGSHLLCRGAQWPGGPVFGHWMCEQLPQLRGIEGISNKLNLSPSLIINREAPKWQTESLRLMGYQDEKIVSHNLPGLRVKKLIFASLRNFHSNHMEFDPLARKWASNRLIEGLENQSTRGEINNKKNIALLRQNHHKRHLINSDELKVCLKENGFHVFEDLADIGFIDSAKHFINASNFFATYGSGISRIMFMREPKKLIELYSVSIDYSDVYFLLASEFDMDYECIAAGTMPKSYSKLYLSSNQSKQNYEEAESWNAVIPEITSSLKDL
jgi:hypothetical protein